MATVVCQGLQSRLESQLAEPTKFRLKLSSPRAHFSQPLELALKSRFFDPNTKEIEEKCRFEEIWCKTNSPSDKCLSLNPDLGGWSFLQALSTCPKEAKEQEKPYVHPMVKRSLSSLSAKSLELCTENLGNETGSDIVENSIFSLSSSDYSHVEMGSPSREQAKSQKLLGADKKSAISRNFPPPLTTISGSESLRVRPHREDGRLLIEAIKSPSPHSLFQAERSNGRLRLLLFKNSAPSFDYSETSAHKESEGSSEENQKGEFENGGNFEGEAEEYDLYEDVEEGEGQESASKSGEEDIEGNCVDVGVEMGMEKFQRAGRCKEGEHELHHENNVLLNLVATS